MYWGSSNFYDVMGLYPTFKSSVPIFSLPTLLCHCHTNLLKLFAHQALMPTEASCPLVGNRPMLSTLFPTELQTVPLLLFLPSLPHTDACALLLWIPPRLALSPVQTPASEGCAPWQKDGLLRKRGTEVLPRLSHQMVIAHPCNSVGPQECHSSLSLSCLSPSSVGGLR